LSLRSPALAVLGVVLLASSAALGLLLVHDGEAGASPDLARAVPGEPVRIKGEPAPFVPPPGALRQWRPVLPLLGNHTYALDAPASDGGEGAAGVEVLLTSPLPAPAGVVLADGTVGYVGPHPDGSGRLLVLVQVREWQQPLLFR
jgi:hypothetical protein